MRHHLLPFSSAKTPGRFLVELAAKSQCVRAFPVLKAEGEICAHGCSSHPASVTALM